MARVACLSLPLLPLQVLLREHPNWGELPAAVIREDKPASPLLFINRAAREAGARVGMRHGDALALIPRLRAAPLPSDALEAARARLLRVVSGFTPEIEPCPFDAERFWLDAGGLTYLYRSLPEWIAALREALAGEGFRSRVVVGFTRFGSYLLARSWRKSAALPSARLERVLVLRSPAAALPLSLRTREILRRLRIATVRDFLALPRDAVCRRFGEEARILFDFATSSSLLPLQPLRFEEPAARVRTFDSPITSVELLIPQIAALLDGALASAGKAGSLLSELRVILRSEEGDERSESIRPAQPTSDRRLLLQLVRLRLSSLLAPEPPLSSSAQRAGRDGLRPAPESRLPSPELKPLGGPHPDRPPRASRVAREPSAAQRDGRDGLRPAPKVPAGRGGALPPAAQQTTVDHAGPPGADAAGGRVPLSPGPRGGKAPPGAASFETPSAHEPPRAPLRGGIASVALRSSETPVASRQGQLIEESARRDLDAGARAFALLRARFGNDAVARAALRDSHLPERGFALEPFDRPTLPAVSRSGGASDLGPSDGPAPLRVRGASDPEPRAGAAPPGSTTRPGLATPLVPTALPGASPAGPAGVLGSLPRGGDSSSPRAEGPSEVAGAPLSAVRRIFLTPRETRVPASAQILTHDPVLLSSAWWSSRPVAREYLFLARAGETQWLAHDAGERRWLLLGVVDGVEGIAPFPHGRPPASVRRPARSGPPSYAPLWCKSNFSFLEGASHPEELVEQAAALGLPALALTDRDGLYGIVKGYARLRALADASAHAPSAGDPLADSAPPPRRAAESGTRSSPRLIVGAEMTIAPSALGGPSGPQAAPKVGKGGRPASGLLLLAADHTGYENLCELISAGRLRSPKGESSVMLEEVCARADGLIALWTGGEGMLPALAEVFRARLYAVIARHRWFGDPERERAARRAAARFNIPLVAATEVLYHDRARKPLQDLITCVRHGMSLERAGTLLTPPAEHDLKSAVDFAHLYRDDPSLVERTLEIAKACTFSLAEIEYRYPEEAAPAGLTTGQWLRRLTYEGARARYGGSVPSDVAAQLERELAVIEELRYCGYFLTMREVVQYCRQNGILCQGRGSAANSAVCYCLGITAIDPVRMDLLFERFLSHERAEPPDIDLDIEHNRREEVIQHMYRTYGRDRAAMVANVIRYRARSAVREVGKALGLPAASLDRCARLLPHWEDDGLAKALAEAGLDPALPLHRHLLELTQTIVGCPRHLSIHPGGFLLGSAPVTRIVPIENATMPERTVIQWDKEDVETLGLFKVDLLGLGALTHLDYSFRLLARHYGIDLSMATIPAKDEETFAMIQRADTIGVFQIESRAQMAMLPRLLPACYYDLVIEVSLVRPGPITGGMVHPYLRRRQKKEEVVYPHPSLEPVLAKTLGVPLFQEQVMKLAVVAAGYSPGEADQLRRDMAAWRLAGKIEKHRSRLVSGMLAKGISPQFAESVFLQIRGFGEYGFPESHAASFALIAYATAWMKCHYPAAFFCALLNAWPMGFYLPSTIVEDAKRHGVRVLPVDALASDWDCALEPDDPEAVALNRPLAPAAAAPPVEPPGALAAARGLHLPPGPDTDLAAPPAAPRSPRAPTSKPPEAARGASERAHPSPLPPPSFAIRMGLRYVKGLAKGDWERIAAARARADIGDDPAPEWGLRAIGGSRGNRAPRHRLRTVADFAAATGLARDALEQLAESGALSAFGIHRRQALWEALAAGLSAGRRPRGSSSAPQSDGAKRSSSPAGGARIVESPPLVDFPEEPSALAKPSRSEEITWDLETSGHSARGHVVELFRAQLASEGLPDSAAVNRLPDKTQISFAGYVICRQMPGNAKGVVFMTVEDEAGVVNVVAWRNIFARYRTLILTSWFLGVTGRIQSSDGVVHLVADSFWRPRIAGNAADRSLALDSHDFY